MRNEDELASCGKKASQFKSMESIAASDMAQDY
jgi:hypothetical protein